MNFEEAKERAVKYLVLALRTEKEVKDKLRKLNVEEDIIDEVCEYLKGLGYINDVYYTEAYLRQCESIPKYSKYEIKMKLIQKGIDKDLASEKIANNLNPNYEKKLVDKLMNRKLKNMEPLKQKAYLYRRGFRLTDNIELD